MGGHPKIRLLPAEWPASDRAAWEAMLRQGDVLDGRGEAAHWAPATRRTNAARYGLWLAHLAAAGRLDPEAGPWERVTPDAVRGWVEARRARVAPRTVASEAIALKCVMRRMAPERDWRWLMDLANRLDAWAKPSIDRAAGLPRLAEVRAAALADLARIEAKPAPRSRDAVEHRDALAAALLCTAPVRLRNLVMIEIGRHLVREADGWALAFGEDETKTRRAIRHPLPRVLVPHLERHLERLRPLLSPGTDETRLWRATGGRPLAYVTMQIRLTKVTARLLGVAFGAHAFRTLAASALADASAEDALHARPLLGHVRPDTTERHYVRATQVEAGRRVHDILAAIKGPPRRSPRP